MLTLINKLKQIIIKDEGSSITPDVGSINFTGAGVTATASGNDVTVTITGGGAGGTGNTLDIGLNNWLANTLAGTYANAASPTPNTRVYYVTASGTTPTQITQYLQFVVPANYASGGTFIMNVLRNITIASTSLTIYVDGVVTAINGTSFTPTNPAVYETKSFVLGALTPGQTVTCVVVVTVGSGNQFWWKDIYFNYQS